MKAEIVLDWPPRLDGRRDIMRPVAGHDDQLQLMLQVTITGTQDGEAQACILSYHFPAAEPAQAEQRAESAAAA